MRKMTLFVAVFMSVFAVNAFGEEYRGIFWNLHSGNSSSTLLASQMVAKGDIDFWGLSEVQGPADVAIFEAALENANPGVDFIAQTSEEGGSDQLAIIYRADRLKSVAYTGNATIDDIGDNFLKSTALMLEEPSDPRLALYWRETLVSVSLCL